METGLPLYVVLRFKRAVSEKVALGVSAGGKQASHQLVLFPECLIAVNTTSFHWCPNLEKAHYYFGSSAANRVVEDIQERSKTAADYIFCSMPYDQVPQNHQMLGGWSQERLSAYLRYGLLGL